MTDPRLHEDLAARRLPCPLRAVIFDGDDTLWLTEQLYDDARSRARGVVEATGLDGSAWEAVQRSGDLANVATLGHGTQRFPTSCVEAFDLVGGPQIPDAAVVREQIRAAAATVFTARAPLREGVAELLSYLRKKGIRIALLTKGDPEVQAGRVAQSGLADRFDLVEIVDHKSPVTFLAVAHQLGCPPRHAMSVGNSVESDIVPSLEAGILPLWIPAYVWSYEQRHNVERERDLWTVASLVEVADLIRASDAAD